MIRLIVGLGNPGSEYEDTRHNAGFWWVDAAARKLGASLSRDRAYHGLVARVNADGATLWLLEPQTFMNLSGKSVTALARFFKITPAEISIRFDTHFFLAPLPDGQEPRVDGDEIVDARWYTPQAALDAHTREEIALVFPTIKHLEQLSPFESADALLGFAAGREVVPVTPRVVLSGEVARVVLPGEPGYEDAA